MKQKYEEQKALDRQHALYKHGFRLLEEQLGLYIKEHYSGISTIEFTEISGYRGEGKTVHPIISDNYGNRVQLDESINGAYGEIAAGGIYGLDYNIQGEEMIYLRDVDQDKEIDVSGRKSLPDYAKLETHTSIDNKIEVLIKDGKIKNVKKDKNGSPKAKIVYNLEIIEVG